MKPSLKRSLLVRRALLAGLFLSPSFLRALPPFIPVEKRVMASSIVLVADVTSSSSQNLNQTIDTADVHLRVLRVLKGPAGVPTNLTLQFAVYPESFEARMRRPPEPGRYFVFLNTQETPREGGGTILLYRLYEPNPFAFALWSEGMEQKLIKFLKKENNK